MTDPLSHDRDYLVPDLEPYFQREPLPVPLSRPMPRTRQDYLDAPIDDAGYVHSGAANRQDSIHLDVPKIIALCGNPGAGKSEVQRILRERHGVVPIDDAWPVRDFAIRHFGLSLEDVTTQIGKDRLTDVSGVQMKNRKILGEAANALEDRFGDHIMPWFALRSRDRSRPCSFGSVRRDQGHAYKAEGGVVIGIRKPGVGPSEFEFDRFDESLVDIWIDNDGNLDHLAVKVTYALQGLRLMRAAA